MSAERIFRVDDRVMQTKNNYEAEWHTEDELINTQGMGIFNGDVGKIEKIDKTDQMVLVDFLGKKIEYKLSSLDEIDLSYAVTVHKSQGSEYPIVIVPISYRCPPMLLTRNLIYTAITRAEKIVILIGDKNTFFRMIDNNLKQSRNTNLEYLLRSFADETN